jgi:hypothetical protein
MKGSMDRAAPSATIITQVQSHPRSIRELGRIQSRNVTARHVDELISLPSHLILEFLMQFLTTLQIDRRSVFCGSPQEFRTALSNFREMTTEYYMLSQERHQAYIESRKIQPGSTLASPSNATLIHPTPIYPGVPQTITAMLPMDNRRRRGKGRGQGQGYGQGSCTGRLITPNDVLGNTTTTLAPTSTPESISSPTTPSEPIPSDRRST